MALAVTGRFNYVEKVLKEWDKLLKLDPDVSALTYGVISLFDGRYLDQAREGLPEWDRANLPKFTDVLHDIVEAGLFARESRNLKLAIERVSDIYGKGAVMALIRVAWPVKVFLLTLVGLAYCKRGEEWGLRLARAAARAGSRLKGIKGRLFDELYKALEGATVDNCVTDEVLRAVYKLYYLYV